MTFRCSISFEHDTQPVETWRGDLEAPNFEDGIRRAVFRAFSQRSARRWQPRSVVVVLEDLAETTPKRANKSGPRSEPVSDAAPLLVEGDPPPGG